MAYKCSAIKRPRIEENFNLADTRFDDCWIHVFKRLPFKKRILLERVSQKWKNLMPYSNIHTFQLAELSWPKSKRIQAKYKIEGAPTTVMLVQDDDLSHVLKSALNRFGPYLQELDFKVEKVQIFRLTKELMDFVVEKAPNLVKLNLIFCLLTPGCFPALQNMGKLEDLNLSRVTIIEEDLSSTMQDLENVRTMVSSTLRNLSTLKKLSLLLDMPVTPPVLNQNLIELNVNGEGMNGEDIRVIIGNCPNLEMLDIEKTAPSFCWAELGQLHNLRKLSLCFVSFLSQDLAAIGKGCPNMEKLHVNFPMDVTSWAELWRLRNLKSLFLYSCWGSAAVTDSDLASVANYRLLETVSLPHAKLTDDGLRNLADKCPNLVWLDLRGVKGISDEGVKVVLENCKHLQMLSLGDTRMKDRTLTTIGVLGSQLSKVKLEKSWVTRNGLRSLFEERKKHLKNGEKLVKLEVLVDKECPISQENLEAVSLSVSTGPECLDVITVPEL